MGGEVRVTLYAAHEESAETAAKAAFARFAELEQVMSDYRPSSEVMQFSAKAGQGFQPISADLMTVLMKSQQFSHASNGAFDVTVSPLVRLWRTARNTGQMPPADQLARARALVGWENLVLDPALNKALLKKPGIQIDLGGIAKGFACDEALKAMSGTGVFRALIEAGGDMAASGPPPGTDGWQISVLNLPNRMFSLSYGAISTSGDANQFVVIDGRRYSHIVDPRTGLGVTNRRQATVFARSAAITDAAATSLCIEGSHILPALKELGVEDAILLSSP